MLRKKLLICSLLLSSSLFAQPATQSTMGIEINPFRLLISNDRWLSVSGTVAHFNNNNGVEIAIPFYYSNESSYDDYISDETRFNLDIHYRKYLFDKETDGLYLGAFGRYTYLDGQAQNSSRYVTINKFGLGIEMGFRLKSESLPLYWGASLSTGRYLGNSNNKLRRDVLFDAGFDDRAFIFDIELLKVGYEF